MFGIEVRNHPVVLVGPLLASRECGSIAPLSWRQFLADLAQIFASVANFSAYYIVTPAARSLAGVTGEAPAAALPDCRPSPSQRQNKRSGGTLHSPDADERGAYLSPAASRVNQP